jgi:hypothetical protein
MLLILGVSKGSPAINKAGITLDKESLTKYFRLHLHRGILYLTGNQKMNKIEDLIRLVI